MTIVEGSGHLGGAESAERWQSVMHETLTVLLTNHSAKLCF